MQNHLVGFDEAEVLNRIKALGHKTPTEIFDQLSDADLCYLDEATTTSANLVALLAMVSFADFIGVNRGLTDSEIEALWDIVSIDLSMELLRRTGRLEVIQGPWPLESFFAESGRALFQIPPALRELPKRDE